jgi:hypothetical protein
MVAIHSGCSTFLKTLAGEMSGIYRSEESMLNYQGLSALLSPIVPLDHCSPFS